MVENTSYMFITGPNVVKTVTHEDVTFEELGGAHVHAGKSGVSHFTGRNDAEALALVRELLSYLPLNNLEDPPAIEPTDDPLREDPDLDTLVPDNPNKPYDMKEVITRVVDHGRFLEVHAEFARNIVVGFARLDGRVDRRRRRTSRRTSPARSTSTPRSKARGSSGSATASTSRSSRSRTCRGSCPAVAQEHGGIIRQGAKLLYAFCEATVPKVTVITRKAYGGAYDVMNSKHIRGDLNLAWPSAEIAVMGPKGAVEIIFKNQIENAADPAAEEARLTREYREKFANPFVAAARGYIDDIIDPRTTRPRLIAGLRLLENKRDKNPPRKHGNIPL